MTDAASESPRASAFADRQARARAWLGEPLDAAGLSAFRVAFGLMGSISALRFLHYGWVDELFAKPTFFFKYWGFDWIAVPSRAATHAMFWALALLGVMVAAGLFYRAAIAAYAVVFTYVQLMDVTNYLNHYYLVTLLAALMATMPLGEAYSLDAWRQRQRRRGEAAPCAHLPRWCTALLRFQVGVVYVFAGLAKLGPDWLLDAQPLGIWLSARTGLPLVGSLFTLPMMPWVMAWAGFLFDTTIPIWLAWSRTRPWAYLIVIAFHGMTSLLFPIGMFPVIMVTGALVFFSPSWPRRLFGALGPLATERGLAGRSGWRLPEANVRPIGTITLALLVGWSIVQLGVPLRSRLYGGDVLWHEQGMRWSWRVMVREKNASVTYRVVDPTSGRSWDVPPHRYLTDRQLHEFGAQPDLVLQLAHRIGREWSERLGHPVAVHADVIASLNGRPAARLVDPAVDLMQIRDGVARASWILPRPMTAPVRLHAVDA